AARIIDPMTKYGRARSTLRGALHEIAEPRAVKDVVAENKRTVLPVDEFFADDESLGNAVGLRLHGIADADAPLAGVAKERLEARHFGLGRDDENVANPGQHQRGQWIINHRLVE